MKRSDFLWRLKLAFALLGLELRSTSECFIHLCVISKLLHVSTHAISFPSNEKKKNEKLKSRITNDVIVMLKTINVHLCLKKEIQFI